VVMGSMHNIVFTRNNTNWQHGYVMYSHLCILYICIIFRWSISNMFFCSLRLWNCNELFLYFTLYLYFHFGSFLGVVFYHYYYLSSCRKNVLHSYGQKKERSTTNNFLCFVNNVACCKQVVKPLWILQF